MSSRIESYESGEPHDHGTGRRHRSPFDEDDAPGYKRQRTALACNSCRFRKSRCNGARPICATCRDLGFDCVYKGPAPAPRLQMREMQSMEKRLQKFEDLLLSIASKQPGNDNIAATVRFAAQPDASSSGAASVAQDSSTLAFSSLNGFQQGQSRTQRDEPSSNLWSATQEDTVDGMGSIIFADERSSGFFGPSSNSSFFSNIARALASATNTMPESKDFSRDLAGNMSRPASPPLQSRVDTSHVNPYKLPSRTEILRLIEIFFSFTGQFFPYLSKRDITESVEELDLLRFSGVRKSWLCLLNAVLAMGTSLDSESGRQVKSREAESDVFFQRALILSPWTISNTANLETREHATFPFARH
jgi:Fungal Zn(2)-Cys(6) binuclear cluster domain